MAARALLSAEGELAVPVPPDVVEAAAGAWVWVDVLVDGSPEELVDIATALDLDPLAVRGAVDDEDLSKLDDFGHHLLVVLHGLRDDPVGSCELDCFVTATHLVTVRRDPSPAVEALWHQVQRSVELTSGGPDQLLGRLVDIVIRSFQAVIDAFDDRIEELTAMALDADQRLVGDLTAVRADLAEIRRAVHPQRETLDQLRRSRSDLLSEGGRRRFSDVFDVADRTALGLDAARSALSETLEAYRGAEARQATEVTKLLTVYAAIMLPLSLVVGFFGMNFQSMPGLGTTWGWIAVTAFMVAIAVLSLGMFVAAGWIRPPSGRRAGAALGRGLVEASKTPVQLVGAVYEVSTAPVRLGLGRVRGQPGRDRGGEGDVSRR